MASVFSRIVNGEIPAYKIAETSRYLAFLDVSPLVPGHTLVIPKQEIDYIFDMDEEAYLGLQLFARMVAAAVGKAVPCKKVGVAVIGLEVPHAHMHLVPLNTMADMDWTRPKLSLPAEEMESIAAKIREFIPGK